VISGAHVMLYSENAEADRAFFRDTLEIGGVDAGGGWLIFALPPTELGIHPAAPPLPGAELFFTCANLDATISRLHGKGVATSPVMQQDWGRAIRITLPSGSQLGIYEPYHAQPDHEG
jgi:hypothetical protein